MALIGLIISHFALVLSLASIERNQRKYFRVALTIVLVGMLLVNDTLRIYGAMAEVPLQFRFVAYGLSLFVIISCVTVSRSLSVSGSEKT